MSIKAKKRKRSAQPTFLAVAALVGFAVIIVWLSISIAFVRPPEHDPRLMGIWHNSSGNLQVGFGEQLGLLYIYREGEEHIFAHWSMRDGVQSLKDSFEELLFERVRIQYPSARTE